MEDNKTMDQEQAATGADEQGQESNGTQGGDQRTFTQEEVDEIIQHRLDRERRKTARENKEDWEQSLNEREQSITSRELKIEALERLQKSNFPKEIGELLDYSNREAFEESLSHTIKIIGHLVPRTNEPIHGYSPYRGETIGTPKNNFLQDEMKKIFKGDSDAKKVIHQYEIQNKKPGFQPEQKYTSGDDGYVHKE